MRLTAPDIKLTVTLVCLWIVVLEQSINTRKFLAHCLELPTAVSRPAPTLLELSNLDLTSHTRLHVAWHQAGKVHRTGHVELPHNPATLAWV